MVNKRSTYSTIIKLRQIDIQETSASFKHDKVDWLARRETTNKLYCCSEVRMMYGINRASRI